MSDFLFASMFAIVPAVGTVIYYIAHDPDTARDLAAWHLRQSQKLNAWAKVQDSRKLVYRKAMAKHSVLKTKRPQLTEVVEG